MKKLFAILLMALSFQTSAQILVPKKDYVPEKRIARYSFCISLLPAPNSGAVSFGIHRMAPDSTVEVNFIRYETFLRQFSGNEECRANPDRIDFLEKLGIEQYIIKEAWKLRYSSYPFGKSEVPGWGRDNGMPSPAQMEELKQFGIERISDVIYGDNLFNLLRKLNDPAWVAKYKMLR